MLIVSFWVIMLILMMTRWSQMLIIVFMRDMPETESLLGKAKEQQVVTHLANIHVSHCISWFPLSLSSLPQCLFKTSPWGRLSGVPLFRTSSFLTASRCPSLCRRPSRHANSRHRSTSSRPTGLNLPPFSDNVYIFLNYILQQNETMTLH